MNLPNVIKNLIEAQNSLNSKAYSACFSETATVIDEGKTYKGNAEIRSWIENANKEFAPVMSPLKYEEIDNEYILSAELSGNFDGSPVLLKYHHTFEGDLIGSLKITS